LTFKKVDSWCKCT